MPTWPAHKIIPTSKLTADNAGNLDLNSHRRAVASATAALTAPSSSLPLPDSSPPPQTDMDDASSQTQTSLKRATQLTESSSSLNSVIIVLPTMSDNAPNSEPKSKKMKISVASSDQESFCVLSDVSIIEIDDIDTPHDEWLNKSHPMLT